MMVFMYVMMDLLGGQLSTFVPQVIYNVFGLFHIGRRGVYIFRLLIVAHDCSGSVVCGGCPVLLSGVQHFDHVVDCRRVRCAATVTVTV